MNNLDYLTIVAMSFGLFVIMFTVFKGKIQN